MKKYMIKFVQFGVDGFSDYKGFETSKGLLNAVIKRELVGTDYYSEFYIPPKLEVGDNLFDYETGTMWEVMGVEE